MKSVALMTLLAMTALSVGCSKGSLSKVQGEGSMTVVDPPACEGDCGQGPDNPGEPGGGETPTPPPTHTKIQVKNTKVCTYQWPAIDDGSGITQPVPEATAAVYQGKFSGSEDLLWLLKDRLTGEPIDCGAFIRDMADRFLDIEKSDFFLNIPAIPGFDPSDYILDVVLDKNADKICDKFDEIVGSSSRLGGRDLPFPLPFGANKAEEGGSGPQFVLTTQLISGVQKGNEDCNIPPTEGNENPICECDELEEPLMLDFGGDGIELSSAADGVRFDISGSGEKRRMAWTKKGTNDAFLARDINKNGKIDNGVELFGTATVNPDRTLAANGLEALHALDSDGNGIYDKNDAKFSELLLWFDRNHNGKSEKSELEKLEDRVQSIQLVYKVSDKSDGFGNHFYAESTATLKDGQEIYAADVWLTFK